MQLDASNGREIADWCGGEYQVDRGEYRVIVPTMHGQIPAYPGEWIIRGIVDFYPMPADQFAASFDPADPVEAVVAAGVTGLAKEWGGRL